MKFKLTSILVAGTLLLSCNSSDKSDLLVIPVDVYQNEPRPLSEISEDIKVIELETTDDCLIGGSGGGGAGRVLVSDDYILFLDAILSDIKILLFDSSGKFLRRIAKKGQGPGEYAVIYDVAADFLNNRIYISTGKLMCYDFEGNFINEVKPFHLNYLNFTNNRLNAITSHIVSGDETDYKINAVLYEINNNLQVIDSMTFLSFNTNTKMSLVSNINNHITYAGGNMYLCYPSPVFPMRNENYIYRDTLYQFKGKELIPQLILKFNNEILTWSFRSLYLYRSSRYVFEQHTAEGLGWFYYDLKTKKGYNMKKGFIDDIHTGENVHIYPFNADADKFYYLYTNMNDSIDDEPNPTLYIGTLKK